MKEILDIKPLAAPKTIPEQRLFAENLAQARSRIADFTEDSGMPFAIATNYLSTLLRDQKFTDLLDLKQESDYMRLICASREDRGLAGFNWIVRRLMGHMARGWLGAFHELFDLTFESYQDMWIHYTKLLVLYFDEAKLKTADQKANDILLLLERHRHYHAMSPAIVNYKFTYGEFRSPYQIQKLVEAHERKIPVGTVCKHFWLNGSCNVFGCPNPHKTHEDLWRAKQRPVNCPVCGKHKRPKLTYCSTCYFEKFPERKRAQH